MCLQENGMSPMGTFAPGKQIIVITEKLNQTNRNANVIDLITNDNFCIDLTEPHGFNVDTQKFC